MTITERTLRQWRKDALINKPIGDPNKDPEGFNIWILKEMELNRRILHLTQELLDLHLMKGK